MTCALPRCRNEMMLVYYGRDVCERHWVQYCDGEIDLKEKLKIREDGQLTLR